MQKSILKTNISILFFIFGCSSEPLSPIPLPHDVVDQETVYTGSLVLDEQVKISTTEPHTIVPWSNKQLRKRELIAITIQNKLKAEELAVAKVKEKAVAEQLKADCASRIETSTVKVYSSRKGVINPWSVGGTPFTNIEIKFSYDVDGIQFTMCVAKFNFYKIPLDWPGIEHKETLRVYLGDNEKDFTVEDKWGRKYTKTAYFTGQFTKKELKNVSDVAKAIAGDSGDSIPMIEVVNGRSPHVIR